MMHFVSETIGNLIAWKLGKPVKEATHADLVAALGGDLDESLDKALAGAVSTRFTRIPLCEGEHQRCWNCDSYGNDVPWGKVVSGKYVEGLCGMRYLTCDPYSFR